MAPTRAVQWNTKLLDRAIQKATSGMMDAAGKRDKRTLTRELYTRDLPLQHSDPSNYMPLWLHQPCRVNVV